MASVAVVEVSEVAVDEAAVDGRWSSQVGAANRSTKITGARI